MVLHDVKTDVEEKETDTSFHTHGAHGNSWVALRLDPSLWFPICKMEQTGPCLTTPQECCKNQGDLKSHGMGLMDTPYTGPKNMKGKTTVAPWSYVGNNRVDPQILWGFLTF